MNTLAPYIWVGIGGFFGAIARFFVGRVSASLLGVHFPWGTFIINVSGSFVLGFLMTMSAQRFIPHGNQLQLAIGIGFLGAYTTFSTFEFETHALLGNGQWGFAVANVLGSVLAGLLAVRAGILAARF